jgi:hypothetical protein
MTNNLFLKKVQIDKMSADFSNVIADYEQNSPSKVNVSQSGKYKKFVVKLESDILLTVYQSKSDGVVKSFYVGFDNESSTCYVRDLLC